jgi:hypothetical protein
MNRKENLDLSSDYAIAVKQMQDICADLFEELHDRCGNPITDPTKVGLILKKKKQGILAELEGIASACSFANKP